MWYLAGYLRFSRALKRTLKSADIFERHLFTWLGGSKRLKLYRSAAVSTPMLTGLLHPMLVIPDRIYSENMLRDILRHELTHYKRKDLIVKWFAVFVTAVHWFNPVVHLVRHELDRECEMSCDERLLRTMDRDAKQHYGETLLSMAADNSLPRRLVATTFATEKRNLKERLEQIMTYKHMGRATLALMLVAALLLVGCGTAVGPKNSDGEANDISSEAAAPTPEFVVAETAEAGEEISYANNVTVSTVDEFLAAIAPDTAITLKAGTYNLFEASNYGQGSGTGYYSWEDCYDGYQLNIRILDKLSISAEPGAEVKILAESRYVNVLNFVQCTNVALYGLTVGHTDGATCSGGVVRFDTVTNASVNNCKLFGCGTVGVVGYQSSGLRVTDTDIYECSLAGTQLVNCENVLYNNCRFYDNDQELGFIAQFFGSDGIAITNSEIHDNNTGFIVFSSYSSNVYFGGNKVENNKLSDSVIYASSSPITIEDCSFSGNSGSWFKATTEDISAMAVDAEGNELSEDDLSRMVCKSVADWSPISTPAMELEVSEDGYIHVSTVDELLAAIAPDTKIYLEDGVFDLTTASDYGKYGNQYYTWQDTYADGPELVISGVKNLTITGSDVSRALIQAAPRYAEVLKFEYCENISLSNFTAGHSEGTAKCAGGVLFFNDCSGTCIDNCSLYGCGVWGITANNCVGMNVTNTEIYDCEFGDLNLDSSENLVFENCNFHDNGPSRYVKDCIGTTLDGVELESF